MWGARGKKWRSLSVISNAITPALYVGRLKYECGMGDKTQSRQNRYSTLRITFWQGTYDSNKGRVNDGGSRDKFSIRVLTLNLVLARSSGMLWNYWARLCPARLFSIDRVRRPIPQVPVVWWPFRYHHPLPQHRFQWLRGHPSALT